MRCLLFYCKYIMMPERTVDSINTPKMTMTALFMNFWDIVIVSLLMITVYILTCFACMNKPYPMAESRWSRYEKT
ncbi:hypothetical protein AXI59_09675 [Bacillus nakamurai]|uniref:Uncharacterized protein n=1 Tax=Bacillus nakamurai TaxID=1793963 RepID=A0A150F8L0_9BACI|nr:hypothetical protein AXI58_10925 [Bacillus nakamurai]KXZ22993.1 hypothetical protein AXI59_09675 [Bacillus nakamurai]